MIRSFDTDLLGESAAVALSFSWTMSRSRSSERSGPTCNASGELVGVVRPLIKSARRGWSAGEFQSRFSYAVWMARMGIRCGAGDGGDGGADGFATPRAA